MSIVFNRNNKNQINKSKQQIPYSVDTTYDFNEYIAFLIHIQFVSLTGKYV